MTHFYLGAPEPSWLWRSRHLPLFVSHRRLRRLRRLRPATTPWALDSGGFYEIGKFGQWTWTPREYVEAVARYDREIGWLEWAAPMDWMCEAKIRAVTGLTVAEHQRRTVGNFLVLRALWSEYSDDTCPIMPVLQGDPDGPVDGPESHVACVQLYREHGVDLYGEMAPNILGDAMLVGVGSVCRQENTEHIGATLRAIREVLHPDAQLHGFGVKSGGLRRYGALLDSADSQAWSRVARYERIRLADCEHSGVCSWCPRWALQWRERVLDALGGDRSYHAPHFAELDVPELDELADLAELAAC